MAKKKKSITELVVLYQQTKDNEVYTPIKKHYDNFKRFWYMKKFSGYMDWDSFESEYDYKLCQSVQHFDYHKAKTLALKNERSESGMFNRFFFQVKNNWWLNVKMGSYRHKRRPLVQCPACNRMTVKIDEEHLKHKKELKDIPKAFIYNDVIYEVKKVVGSHLYTWGVAESGLLDKINQGIKIKQKKKIKWMWYKKNGDPGVKCPFTMNIVDRIDLKYIRSLPEEYSCYARPLAWSDFIRLYPFAMLESEVYSLEFNDESDDDLLFGDKIEKDYRRGNYTGMVLNENEDIQKVKHIPFEYEDVFYIIDKYIDNTINKRILKLISIGYSIEDIASTLILEKKEVRKRIKSIREIINMKNELIKVS